MDETRVIGGQRSAPEASGLLQELLRLHLQRSVTVTMAARRATPTSSNDTATPTRSPQVTCRSRFGCRDRWRGGVEYSFHIVDVFSRSAFGGNPLAVLPKASGISPEGMQKIAREFNFAETTFVLPATDSNNTCQVRIFTPRTELAFAGHPTVGT